jgi:L-threonylcarbamoyladenylate synthase
VVSARYLALDEHAPAPGQFLKHYSPRAELRVVEGPPDAAGAYLKEEAGRLMKSGRRVGVLAVDEEAWALEGIPVARLGPQADPAISARRLFAALRELDALGVDVILARLPEAAGLGLAIRDRLFRAAEGRVRRVSE